jgi:hypothetical protein
LRSLSPRGPVGRQAFNLAGGQFKFGYTQVIDCRADPSEHAIPPGLRRRLTFG